MISGTWRLSGASVSAPGTGISTAGALSGTSRIGSRTESPASGAPLAVTSASRYSPERLGDERPGKPGRGHLERFGLLAGFPGRARQARGGLALGLEPGARRENEGVAAGRHRLVLQPEIGWIPRDDVERAQEHRQPDPHDHRVGRAAAAGEAGEQIALEWRGGDRGAAQRVESHASRLPGLARARETRGWHACRPIASRCRSTGCPRSTRLSAARSRTGATVASQARRGCHSAAAAPFTGPAEVNAAAPRTRHARPASETIRTGRAIGSTAAAPRRATSSA